MNKPKGNWVLIYTAQGESETAVIASVLESEDIPYKISRESVGPLHAIYVDGLGEVKIFVPEENAAAATELLASKEE